MWCWNPEKNLRGIIEWYDRDCIKLTGRARRRYLMIFKRFIKYVHKDGEESANGGSEEFVG